MSHTVLPARSSKRVFATATCPSVCLSATAGIVSKRLNLSENFFDHLVAPSLKLFWPLRPYQIPRGTPSAGALNTRGLENLAIFNGNCRLSETVRDRPWLLWNGRTVIGSHRCRIEWYHFRWPWLTPNPGFKATVYLQVDSQKRLVLGTNYNTNRKPYTIYRMIPFSMTFTELLTPFSRSLHFSTLNIPETIRDTAIVTIERLSHGDKSFPMTLTDP